jgi:hypothetical protein
MDPTLIAGGIVSALVTFLKAVADKTMERGSDAAADAAVGRLRALYQAIKAKLSSDDVDAGVLERFEADPASTARQRTLEGVLAEALQNDAAFAEEVARLLASAQPRGQQLWVIDSGVVAGGDVHQRGQFVAGRDLTVGETQEW